MKTDYVQATRDRSYYFAEAMALYELYYRPLVETYEVAYIVPRPTPLSKHRIHEVEN